MYNLIYNNHRITFGNYNVGIELPYVTITYSTVEHGTLTGVDTALIGSTVTVTAIPSAGYALTYITVNGEQIVGNSFVATENATVGAVFTAIAYTITYDTPEHGSITGPATATAGSTVTVTVTPDSGYGLSYVTVGGVQITGTSFTMPSGNVTVSAVMQEYYYFKGTPTISKAKLIEPTTWTPISSLPSVINPDDSLEVAYKTSRANDTSVLSSYRAAGTSSGLWIGDNCYNSSTAPTFTFGDQQMIHIGNNSLNGSSTQVNITALNVNNSAWEIGSNSCTNWNLTMNANFPLTVGAGSLRTLTISNNEAKVIFNGMPGSNSSIIPIIIGGNRDRCTFDGLTQAMVKPGSTWRKVISYTGSTTCRIQCSNMTSADISWLNSNRYYFIDGNYSNITFV